MIDQTTQKYIEILDGIFTEEFKKDMIDVCSNFFGEHVRGMATENMKKIKLYPKFVITKEQKLIEAQKTLLNKIKETLPSNQAKQIEDEISKYNFDGGFGSIFESLELEILFSLFEEPEHPNLCEIVKKYQLNEPIESLKKSQDVNIKQYVQDVESAKEETSEELMINVLKSISPDEDYSGKTVEELAREEHTKYSSGSFITCLKDSKTGESYFVGFIDMMDGEEEALAEATHEVAHALEYILGKDGQVKTGHKELETGEENTFTSECIHQAFLNHGIIPEMQKRGYKYPLGPKSDYELYSGKRIYKVL